MADYKGINLLVDTRQQANKHDLKDKFFEESGINTLRSKLPFGDYALINDMSLVVDTKKDFLEIEKDLTTDHIRFRNEIINANKNGIGLVILIEEEMLYKNLEDVKQRYKIPKWKSTTYNHKRGQPMAYFNVESIVKAMETMQQKYAVLFHFTTKERCGATIMKILVDYKDKYKCYFDKKLKEIKENGNN